VVHLALTLFQFFTHRRETRSIEILKAELQRNQAVPLEFLKVSLGIYTEAYENELRALKEMVEGIQVIRDRVRSYIIISTPPHFHRYLREEAEDLSRQLRDDCDKLMDAYNRNPSFSSR
jgi:hypothetical protein